MIHAKTPERKQFGQFTIMILDQQNAILLIFEIQRPTGRLKCTNQFPWSCQSRSLYCFAFSFSALDLFVRTYLSFSEHPAVRAMGFHFLVTGFFLKSVCADNIASIIDPAWSTLSTSDHWIVPILYYCQIYGDFGGYSLMALGMARLLGFRLPANFRSPMRAASLQEFWHRWHITLSRWLRDYLYVPLGGSRTGNTATNLMITMLLGGLWHGNAWGFVFWGFLHGAGLAAERLMPAARGTALWWIVTQTWVTLAWIPFRMPHWNSPSSFASQVLSHSANGEPVAFALAFAAPIVIQQFLPLFIPRIGHRRLPIYLGAMTAVLLVLDLSVVTPSRVFLYFSF